MNPSQLFSPGVRAGRTTVAEPPLPAERAPQPRARRVVRPVGILGTGAHAPARVLDNEELSWRVDTSDAWIVERTGMRERHIAAEDEATSDMAVRAARRALARARLRPSAVQLIVVATVTPDMACPPTACLVQRGIGAAAAAGFDLSAACSSFINALMTARGLVACGTYDNALVIGADKLSSITNYEDRESCILFGDGAGAVVLGADPEGGELLDHVVGIDGGGAALIEVPAGGSRRPASHATVEARQHFLVMQGREVFKFAVQKLVDVVEQVLHQNGFSTRDLALLVPHQANLRILEAAARKLALPPERMVVNVDRYGNTSSASIPMALDEAARAGRIAKGELVCLAAFGGGLSWGAALLRW